MHQMSGRVVGSGAKGAPVFEAMEPRLLLDSHPLITEFMASNGSYLETRIRADAGDPFEGEPDTPDWIEIYNPTDSAVSLDGYFLTDDAEDPAQWAFPSGVTLASGEYLIVYATGEDITDPALDETGRYHTNFGLSASGGEDCVLSYYDTGLGQYVAVTEFLDFPEQERDISFGLYEDQDVTPIAPAHSLADILVPTAATSTSWYTEGYTPSGWMVGETGVGFENSIPGIFTTLYKAKSGVSVGDLAAAEAMIANPSQQAAVYTDVTSWVNFYDTGSGHGHDSASEVPFPGVSDADDYATVSVGEVTIPAAGTYTFAVNSDDGFRLTLTGGSVTGTYADGEATLGSDWFAHEAPRGTADTLGAFYFPAAGAYPFELVWYERGGGAAVELWGAAGTRTSWSSAFELVGNTAEGGLEARYNPGAGGAAAGGYTDDIHTDIEAEMYGQNDSVYLRVAFDVTDPGAYDSLYLRMKYDDGFVAYLNGTKVAARNAPASPAWDSSATDVHPNSEAVAWADINISGHLGLLHPGTNVLAIQGLNAPTDDKDLLLLPELADIDSAGLSEFYFATASPGGPNLDAYVAVVADTKFDHDRGFYDAPFDVAITSDTEGAEIYWTLNGNSPLDADGTPSPDAVLYDAGDPDAVPHVTGSAVLRAVALKENYLPTNVDTQTYIFLDGVIHQPANPDGFPGSWGGTGADYEMDTIITEDPEYAPLMMDSLTSVPTMSLVMDLDDLFGASQGIYANPWSEGAGWERPGSLEMFYPDGYDAPDDGFQVNAGVRMYGGVGRREDCLKHSFRVLFKGDYGPTKLNYSLFGGDAAEQFDTIILRSNFNDGYSWHWGSPKDVQHIRDEYARRISTLLGARAPTGNFVHLYINGLYWGLYNPVERPDQSFGPPYFGGGDKDNWDAYNSGEPTGESDPRGSADCEYDDLMDYVEDPTHDMTLDEHYQYIQGNNPDGTPNPDIPVLLDVANYARFLLANFFVGNSDWPHHNWYAARQEDPGSTGFKAFTWDAEWTVDMRSGLTTNRTGVTGSIAVPYEHLRHNEDFQLLFADIAHWAFSPGGPLYVNPDAPAWDPAHPENNQPAALWAELCDWIEASVIAETARWGDIGHPGDPATLEHWQDERDWILNNYMPQRSGIVLGQLEGAGLYPDIDAPVFEINGQPLYGGTVEDGDVLSMTPGGTTIYYTLDGTDPRAFDGTVNPSATPYGPALTLTGNEHVKARVRHNGEWSALSDAFFIIGADDLRITEIMYNPADPTPAEVDAGFTDSDDFEYIELLNIGPDPVSLGGLGFVDGVDFFFPMVDLAPGAYGLIVENQAAFEFRYGTGCNIIGEYTGTRLSNGGEGVRLATVYGGQILDFDYEDDWFDHTDGEGFSLVVNDPTQDPALWDTKTGWRPSWQSGGNPGAADPGPDLHAVVVSELRAHSPDGGVGDWIELLNQSDDTVDIDGWYLSDSNADPAALMAYQISSAVVDTALSPGEYLFLTQNAHFGGAFALSEFGEGIYLTADDGTGELAGYREDEFFGASLTGDTFGRYIVPSTGDKEFVRLVSPTPGAANADPVIPDVVINEIMYNPPESPIEGHEFIELYNTTGADVPLYDPAHPENAFKFTDGIAFTFPAGATVPAGGYALVVGIDPAAFRAAYDIPLAVPIYGPYTLNLANDGERVTLSFPGQPEWTNPPPGEVPGYVPYVLYETVDYNDNVPWPTRADGDGSALERIDPAAYADEVANWQASTFNGSAGATNTGLDTTPPTAPGDLAATRLGETCVQVAWSPAGDPESGIGTYRIYRDTLFVGETTGTAWYDTDLASPAPDVSYRVAAVNLDDAEGPATGPAALESQVTVDSLDAIDAQHLDVVFTRPVDETSAETLAHYDLVAGESTALGFADADLLGDGVTVRLTLAGSLVDGSHHALAVSGVEAADGTPIAPGVRRVFHYGIAAPGSIMREWWLGIGGQTVSELTSHPDYPDNPDGRDWESSFEAPVNWADSYGQRMRGWLVPQETNDYTFWIASDDNSELWLSTDDDPANKEKIAWVTAWSGSRQWYDDDAHPSDPITLVAGQWYYIEALQKEGWGGDNLAVAWTRPDESPTVPIPGRYLVPTHADPLPDAVVSVAATDPDAAEQGTDPGEFTLTRAGGTDGDLLVYYTLTGSAGAGDYEAVDDYAVIPAGQSSVTVDITPVDDDDNETDETVVLNLAPGSLYHVDTAAAVVTLADNELAAVEDVVLNPDPARTRRTVGDIEPSGIGVRTVEITFSEPVDVGADAVTVEAGHFDAGLWDRDHLFGAGEVTVAQLDPDTHPEILTVTIANSWQTATDTWVKVTLSDAAADLSDLQGHALDGEPRLDSSGLGYLYDADADLPTGDGLAGGEAVFYVGSLRADMRGSSLFATAPDGQINSWDINGFLQKYQAGDPDADFRGQGIFASAPDGVVDSWDINGFLQRYQGGASLAPLPTDGTLSAGAPAPLALTTGGTLEASATADGSGGVGDDGSDEDEDASDGSTLTAAAAPAASDEDGGAGTDDASAGSLGLEPAPAGSEPDLYLPQDDSLVGATTTTSDPADPLAGPALDVAL